MERDPGEITQKVLDREKDFNTLYGRMDRDNDLRWLTPTPSKTVYEQTTIAKTGGHPTDVEVFSNRPCTFADAVQTILLASEMQIIARMAEVKGEDMRDEQAKLERLLHFFLYKADEKLRRIGLPPLKLSLIELALIRGGVAGRFVIYKVKDKIIPDFISFDPRGLTYEFGSEGLLWAAHKTLKSGPDLLDKYEKKVEKKTDNEVIDYWENDKGDISNSVICNKQFLKEPIKMQDELGYALPSMPVLIMPVPNRTPMSSPSGSNSIAWGESIFAPIRDIIVVRNRFATIVATHAGLMAKQPLFNYRDEQGTKIESSVYYAGGVLDLVKGHQEIVPSPMKETSSTVVQILNWFNNEVEDGTLPRIDIGNPPASGTALNLVQEAGNKVFNPQLNLLENFYTDICLLTEEQLLAGKIKVKLQGIEKNKYYEFQATPVDLKRPHIIQVEFTARTPWTQMDAYQIADMAKRSGLPDSFIHEYILKIPDPKGMGDEKAIELWENSPKGAMLRAIKGLLTRGRIEEAQGLMEDFYKMVMQEEAISAEPEGAPAPPVAEAPAPAPEGEMIA